MKNPKNTEQGGKDKRAELTEKMIDLLFSGEQLSEEVRDGLCRYLSDENNASYNEEALFLYFSARSKPDQPIGKSVFADDMWPEISRSLGMDPHLEHYRAIRAARENAGEKSTIPTPTPLPAPVRTLRRPSWRRTVGRIAAVLFPVVFVVGGYLGWEAMRADRQGDGAVFVASQAVTTQPDSVRTITLADGTEVTLNRNSTLAYNENREAELSGEAYFKVAKDPEHPFVIHSGNLKVTVLGTEFNFLTQTGEGSSVLSLYEGRVQLDNSAGTYNLDEGGREFTFDPATGRTDIQDFDPMQKPEWLVAAQEPQPEIIPLSLIFDLIEESYGVEILNREAADTTRRFNFMLDATTTIDEVMQALQFASDEFDYTINDKYITLEKN